MYIHNLDPNLIDLGFFQLKWYSIAYILGILLGWYLGKKIILHQKTNFITKIKLGEFDDFITFTIVSVIIGGRLGYILFYNLNYYLQNPFEIIKIWEGGMSFHGGLLGVIIGTYIFSKLKNVRFIYILDIVSCVAPIGLFFGRIANFINSELYGKPTEFFLGVVFPQIDNFTRHPSQLYEAFLEGLLLLIILNFLIFKKIYKEGYASSLFLILYGIFRIFAEQFREPDVQIGYIFNVISMGSLLSIIMTITGIILFFKFKND